MKYTFRPLNWTDAVTPTDQRRSRYTFKASWAQTLSLLEDELWYLDAADIVFEADFRDADIRQDGMPRQNARSPVFPGVRIAFGSRFGPLIYSTDAHEFWQHNVRGIALGLQALRAVDRYGVTRRGEQYTGWRALPSGIPMPAAPMTKTDAAHVLGELAGWVTPPDPADPAVVRLAYREAARRVHPDTGGSTQAFQRLQQAARVFQIGAGS